MVESLSLHNLGLILSMQNNTGNKSELNILKVLIYQVGRKYNQNKIWSDVINANIKQMQQMKEQNKHTNQKKQTHRHRQ